MRGRLLRGPYTGRGHEARKRLFVEGLRRGYVTGLEVEQACHEAMLTGAECEHLRQCLDLAQIEIREN